MILYTPGNKPHLDENDTSSGWRRGSISEIGLEPNAQSQRRAGIDLWYR